MRQDITLVDIQAAKVELEGCIEALGIEKLVKKFYDKTGIRVKAIKIDWVDVSQVDDPCYSYRMLPGLLSYKYEKIEI
jgi:hypothetical protein